MRSRWASRWSRFSMLVGDPQPQPGHRTPGQAWLDDFLRAAIVRDFLIAPSRKPIGCRRHAGIGTGTDRRLQHRYSSMRSRCSTWPKHQHAGVIGHDGDAVLRWLDSPGISEPASSMGAGLLTSRCSWRRCSFSCGVYLGALDAAAIPLRTMMDLGWRRFLPLALATLCHGGGAVGQS